MRVPPPRFTSSVYLEAGAGGELSGAFLSETNHRFRAHPHSAGAVVAFSIAKERW